MFTYKRPQQIKNLIRSFKNGATIADACAKANIDPSTYWRWMNKSDKFRSTVYKCMENRTDKVVDALFTKAIEGNVDAQKFFLKNRAAREWQDRSTHEVNQTLTEERKVVIIHNAVGDDDYRKATGKEPAKNRINSETSPSTQLPER